MAKRKAPTVRSRAARRATSPSIDTDKSLKDIRPPSRSTTRPSVLAAQHAAGISKKTKRKSQMSAKARRRHEKGLEMAEAVGERTKEKVEKSRGRGRSVKERSRKWEDINKAAGFEVLAEGGEGEKEGWETDEDMGGAEETVVAPMQDVVAAVEPAQVPLPPIDDDDEIL